MKEIRARNPLVLEIDLGSGSSKTISVSLDDALLYLGGKGLAMKLLYERLVPKTDPLGPDNILVLMTGPLSGTGAPCSARFSCVTKSPLTHIIAHSSCGGPFGLAIKAAGFDGVIITGKAPKPVRIHISPEGVKVKDGRDLWNNGLTRTKGTLGTDAFLAIGPAGENQVWYANIASGDRYFGRAGMGAVMGSKNLKAITVSGKGTAHNTEPADPLLFEKLKAKANRWINRNHFTGTLYRQYGTLANVSLCDEGKLLPVRNFSGGTADQAREVYGERFQKEYNTQPHACGYCSILCGHKGTYDDGVAHKIPEYETTSLLGPNLGVFDRERITNWNDLCSDLGLDTMSLGSTLGFVMELEEKGGGKQWQNTGLKFGSPNGIAQMIKDIAYRRGNGNELANGTLWLSKQHNAEEYAIQVKGLEMAGYDPRGAFGQGLAFAVANRGACHLSAGLFFLEVFTGYLDPHSTRGKADYVVFLESLNNGINSLPTCLFTSFAYLQESLIFRIFQFLLPSSLFKFAMRHLYFPVLFVIKLMGICLYTKLLEACTGLKMGGIRFLRAGNRIHTLERYMNTREGISRKDDTLPERFLKDVPLKKMIDAYYRKRGFDRNGIPTDRTLKKFGIL